MLLREEISEGCDDEDLLVGGKAFVDVFGRILINF